MLARKRSYAIAALPACLCLWAAGSASPGSPLARAASRAREPDSGITGQVLIGPTCPVQRPGMSCERPYQATITIRRGSTHSLVGRVRSSAQGRFRIALAPGTYLLVPQNGHPYPRSPSKVVTVDSHRYTAVSIRYDSGIR